MIKIDNRESAHVKSRIKDLSKVQNVVSFTGLFACITPSSKNEPNEITKEYDPVLCRDVETLITNFGDPRIDPEKYIDLYSIMQIIGNGTSCYVQKVKSGNVGKYKLCLLSKQLDQAISASSVSGEDNKFIASALNNKLSITKLVDNTDNEIPLTDFKYSFTANEENPNKFDLIIELNSSYSSVSSVKVTKASDNPSLGITVFPSLVDPTVTFTCELSQVKPLTLKAFYLTVKMNNIINESEGNYTLNELISARIKLDENLTNQGLVNALNSYLGSYAHFELDDPSTESSCKGNDEDNSIICQLLDAYVPVQDGARKNLDTNPTTLTDVAPCEEEATFSVTLADYKSAILNLKDKKYSGCMMSDLVSPMNQTDSGNTGFGAPTSEQRRSIHYYLKEVAAERKDSTVILAPPMCESIFNNTPFTKDEICDWVSSTGSSEGLWEYGVSNTTDYTSQSFYLEMYTGWLNMKCSAVRNGTVQSIDVPVSPSAAVCNNILASYRERGTYLPVAGDQYGIISNEIYTVLDNPRTKAERDQFVQNRINPIYDTGTRGIQIYGNETLNAGYTDLNAAHIARTLVYIRSRVDEYTETLKFNLNNNALWDRWKGYVSQNILEPLKAVNAIASYEVAMGTDTTTPTEIANRIVKGNVSLVFVQSAEIFDLSFVVNASSTAFE